MTRQTVRILLLPFIVIAVGLPVATEAQVSRDGSARATVVQPVRLDQLTVLDFGEVARSTTAGTIRPSLGNGYDRTGAVTSIGYTKAIWRIVGEPGAAFDVTLPTNPVVLNSSTSTMTATDFAHNAASTVDTSGTTHFNVTATLNVGANQDLGSYSGLYTVTVTYN